MSIAAILIAPAEASAAFRLLGRKIAGRTVIHHVAEALLAHVDLVLPVGEHPGLETAHVHLGRILDPLPTKPTRTQTVRDGLERLSRLPRSQLPSLVLLYDAEWAHIPTSLIANLLAALVHDKAVIPVLAIRSPFRDRTGTIEKAADLTLYTAQTPLGFDFETLLAAYRSAEAADGLQEPELMRRAGIPVAVCEGARAAIELNDEEDLMRLHHLLSPPMQPRTGTGFDVHAFEAGRPLMLCGIEVAFERGLAGHSDADVGLHALCDAIYGALAEGDIGRHFPPSDADWKNADSARFLVHAAGRIAARGGALMNADITLICERPKIGPHAEAMRARLAELLQTELGRISVKATTTERLGFTGRGEGIACQASVTILVPA